MYIFQLVFSALVISQLPLSPPPGLPVVPTQKEDQRESQVKAIFECLEQDDLVRLEDLLRNDPNLANARSGSNYLLHRAVAIDRIAAMKILLRHVASPKMRHFNGFSVLDLAVWMEKWEAVRLLMDSGVPIQQWHAAALGDVKRFREMFERDPKFVDDNEEWANTILHWAIIGNNDEIVKMIMDKKNLTNVAGQDFTTPFHLAIERKREKLVSLMIKCGAKVNEPGVRGYRPIHKAVWTGRPSMVALLLANGARPNVQADGFPPFINDPPVPSLNTPLHEAVLVKNLEMISLLLGHGADLRIANSSKETPLDLARKKRQQRH